GEALLPVLQDLDDVEQDPLHLAVLLRPVECICHDPLPHSSNMRPGLRLTRLCFADSKGEKSRKSPAPVIPSEPPSVGSEPSTRRSLIAGCKSPHPALASRLPAGNASAKRWRSPVWFRPIAARNLTAGRGTIREL